jgi:hypothetical protein
MQSSILYVLGSMRLVYTEFGLGLMIFRFLFGITLCLNGKHREKRTYVDAGQCQISYQLPSYLVVVRV